MATKSLNNSRRKEPNKAPVGRPKGANSKERRQKILDAARYCFAEYGYDASSNSEIGRRAGITAGSIYYYFETKRDMFLTAHQEIQDAVMKRCLASIYGEKKLSAALDSLFDELLQIQIEMPTFGKFSAVVRTEAARHPDLRIAMQDSEWRALYRNLAQLGIKSGEICEANERAVRCVFATLVLGITQHGVEASRSSHLEAMRGLKLLLQGSLVHSTKAEAHAAKRRPANRP
jgi:AcrR family transcriptional regulator